jgi:glycolate oxidase iron-sulfur subunit
MTVSDGADSGEKRTSGGAEQKLASDGAACGAAGNLIGIMPGPRATPAIEPALLDACIHCGLCLPACPTYLATGREMESPRGRIYLLNLYASGSEPLTPRMAEHIESCLGCLGCQTACPSGVRYETILDQARPHLANLRNRRARRLMRYVFSRVLPDYGKLRALGNLLRLWQSAGGQKLVSTMPWLRKAFGRLIRWQSFLPAVPKYVPLPRQSWLSGQKTGTVQLFAGCVMDIFYNQVNHACARLLSAQRKIVEVPEQTCCGALAFHAGEIDIARDQAKRNIELLENKSGEIVVTAAGCGAMLKGYGELLGDDEQWRQRAVSLSARIKDVTEALAAGEFATKPRRIERTVTYHAACHLAHAQNVRAAPARLLAAIPGLTVVPLEEHEHCCGSAGIFNLTHTELSLKVLERKVAYLKETGADTVVTTNPGCMLQLETGLKSAGLALKTQHLVELLDQAYQP